MTSDVLQKYVNLDTLSLEVLGFDWSPIDITHQPKLSSLKMSIYFHFGIIIKDKF